MKEVIFMSVHVDSEGACTDIDLQLTGRCASAEQNCHY